MNSLLEYASSLSNLTKWHANHDKNQGALILKAGHLSMIYENGSLRSISINNQEVLRMIYCALRDKTWFTIDPEISGEEFDIRSDWFIIKYNCLYKSGEINFSARCIIEGKHDNSLIFNFEGKALSAFEKNRIGFCVLHPVEECTGQNCTIRHTNGEVETSIFPKSISPHQPFRDIKSMTWKLTDYICTLDFYGDVFETEDQRNWTDASYKTYCTPLDQPFPVRIEKSEKVSQRVELKVAGSTNTKKDSIGQIVITLNADKTFSIPKIGIGQSTRPESLTPEEIQIIKKFRFDHYRTDLYLFDRDWKTKATLASNESKGIGSPLELALFFDDNFVKQISDFIDWANETNGNITRLTVFHKTYQSAPYILLKMTVPLLRAALPDIKIGSGTNANFVQLNRNRPDMANIDFICYSIHPQEHANDNSTLIENLRAQSYTVESAREFAQEREIWISPMTIQRRFNANIENFEQPYHGSDCPPQVDARIMSLFGACWTAGSLKYLIEAGINGATFFETVGERGLMQGDIPSRWPEKFPSAKGMIFPIYFVFKYVLELRLFKVIKSDCSSPLKVNSLIFSNGEDLKLIISNFTSSPQKVFLDKSLRGSVLKIKHLDSGTYSDAVSDSNWLENSSYRILKPDEDLLLNPFSVNFIDSCYEL